MDISTLPRQLALEILDSLQTILFSVGDEKSRSILQALVSKEKLDRDCLAQDSFDFRRDDEDDKDTTTLALA